MKRLFIVFCAVFLIFGCGSKSESSDGESGSNNIGNKANSSANSSGNNGGSGLPDSNVEDKNEDEDKTSEEYIEWSKQDDDGDGIPNGIEEKEDADKDGIPNYLDDDSDNDGIPDSVEAPNGVAVDDDEDGIPNYLDIDSDGDGIPDSVEGTEDADGDGVPNYRDEDSDGDKIPDKVEWCEIIDSPDTCTGVDTDGDGTPDYLDSDSDDDEIPDFYEGSDDLDGDDIPNFRDEDSDGDGIPDFEENDGSLPPLDSDGDKTYDFLDLDSDGDGLSDQLEVEIGTNPRLGDSDGDGFDDSTEHLLGTNPNDPVSVIDESIFYVVLPYKGDSQVRTLNFHTDIKKVDVMILVDLSNSMSGEHSNLKSGIKTTIIDGVRAKIEDSAFGLVKFGTLGSQVYTLAQPITTDAEAVKSAVDTIKTCSGADEYHALALWATASDEATSGSIKGPQDGTKTVTTNPPDCSAYPGSIGGACFRDESMPIFIMATDEKFVNFTGTTVKSASAAIEKMNAINAKFIGLNSSTKAITANNPHNDFNAISEGTGSKDGDGNPFNFTIADNGTGFSDAIVDAVIALTSNIQIDITAKAKHVANDFNVADTSKFVKSISPESFPDVKPGQEVSFDITFENDDVYKNDSRDSKIFRAAISVLGDGAFLDTRDVVIVVPGADYAGGNQ